MKMNPDTLQHYRESRQKLKEKTKITYCCSCNKPFTVSIFVKSNYTCPECKEKKEKETKVFSQGLKCKTCGDLFYVDYRKGLYKKPPMFCSKKCSTTFSSSFTKTLKKSFFCENCGKEVIVSAHAKGKGLCKDCKGKKNIKKLNSLSKQYFYSEDTEVGQFERCQAYKQKSENLKKLGFNFSGNLEEEYFKIKNLLMNLYIKEELSTLCIKDLYEIPSTLTIPNFLRLFHIPVRDLKSAGHLSIKSGRNVHLKDIKNVYRNGYYVDKNNKKHYLRSSLEFNLAEKLDILSLDFETEQQIEYLNSKDSQIHYGYPDFFIPKYNLYIETKGLYFYDEQNLRDRAKSIEAQHKNFLVLTYEVRKETTLYRIDNFNKIPEDVVKLFL